MGTGSRTMTIIRIKSLKLYAFGFCKLFISNSALFFIFFQSGLFFTSIILCGFLFVNFYIDIHPYSVCEKLGPKYSSVSVDELNKSHDFYQDLLRY